MQWQLFSRALWEGQGSVRDEEDLDPGSGLGWPGTRSRIVCRRRRIRVTFGLREEEDADRTSKTGWTDAAHERKKGYDRAMVGIERRAWPFRVSTNANACRRP